jgi:hypothetical protein
LIQFIFEHLKYKETTTSLHKTYNFAGCYFLWISLMLKSIPRSHLAVITDSLEMLNQYDKPQNMALSNTIIATGAATALQLITETIFTITLGQNS